MFTPLLAPHPLPRQRNRKSRQMVALQHALIAEGPATTIHGVPPRSQQAEKTMSDAMLLGVLYMPAHMVMGDQVTMLQYVQRGHEAAMRIEADAERIEKLEESLRELARVIVNGPQCRVDAIVEALDKRVKLTDEVMAREWLDKMGLSTTTAPTYAAFCAFVRETDRYRAPSHDPDVTAAWALVHEANDYGQFADDAHWQLPKPVRLAIQTLLEAYKGDGE
jgi:hypothetical protein